MASYLGLPSCAAACAAPLAHPTPSLAHPCRWLYCGALPATPVPNTTLLASYRLASYLGLPSCAAACATALSRLEPDDINDALLRAAFDLPAALRESRALARVMAACTQRLVSEFDDVSGTVSDGVQKERFCGLPHAAVLTWLKAVDLEVWGAAGEVHSSRFDRSFQIQIDQDR